MKSIWTMQLRLISQMTEVSTKAKLLNLEEQLTKIVPTLMKSRMNNFYKLLTRDIIFEDKLNGYNTKNLENFHIHVAKARLYFRFLSPYNKIDLIHTAVYEDSKQITILWRMNTLETTLFTTYNPFYMFTKKMAPLNDKIRRIEGATDAFMNDNGLIFKLVNRTATVEDIEAAKQMSELRGETEEEFERRFRLNDVITFDLPWKKKKSDEHSAEQKSPDAVPNTGGSRGRGDVNSERRTSAASTMRCIASALQPTLNAAPSNNDSATSASSSEDRPKLYQLEHIQKRLEFTIPLMFRTRLDYTFYKKDVVMEDRILKIERRGLTQVMTHFGILSVVGQVACPHIATEILNISPMMDDGTVRVRWRIKYANWLSALNPFNYRADYRMKRLKWFDGYSIFFVAGDGLVYRFTLQKMMPDDESKKFVTDSKRKLADNILPNPT